MDNNRGTGKLRRLNEYFQVAFRFYNLKQEYLTPVLFVILLAIIFLPNLIQEINFTFFAAYIASRIVFYVVSTIYLLACIKEFKNEKYTVKTLLKEVMLKIHKVIATWAIYDILTSAGMFLLIAPGIYFYLSYIFNICYLMDKNESIFGTFKASGKITSGIKLQILYAISFLVLLRLFPFIAYDPAKKFLIFLFVLSFLASVTHLIQQRMVALMYMDLEYGKKLDEGQEWE
ncbi:MAG: hypothetical protein QHH06_02840 [Clostridiales bacterium]|jgi:hypothetical protein|nr:hypothetical protein [Eubacteriales bacterium]MDH7565406.1 hypothetical protein [Clostridiales bacterium]